MHGGHFAYRAPLLPLHRRAVLVLVGAIARSRFSRRFPNVRGL